MVDNDIEEEKKESEIWNLSKHYVYEMIMKPLIEIDYLDKIAVFGYSDIYSDVFVQNENLRTTARLKALPRELYMIRVLIVNSKFILKNKEQKIFDTYYQRLLLISKNLWKLRQEQKRGNKVVQISILEPLFDKIHNEITELRINIMNSLNNVGIIFKLIEELNPEEFKKRFKDKFTGF